MITPSQQDFIRSVYVLSVVKTPNCPVEMGRNVALYAHMGNIAVRSKAYKLEWDEANSRFIDAALANNYIKPSYRKPWVFPEY